MKTVIILIMFVIYPTYTYANNGGGMTSNTSKPTNTNKVFYINVNNKKIPMIFEYSNILPIGFIAIIFNGGGYIAHDKPSIAAFSANLLGRGTKSKGEAGFAKLLESNAIGLNVDSGMESLKFSIDFLKEKEDQAINLLGDLISDPNLTKEALEQTKLNLTSYLLSKKNDFDYIALNNLNKILY